MNPVEHSQTGNQYTHKGFKLLKKKKNQQNPFSQSIELNKSASSSDIENTTFNAESHYYRRTVADVKESFKK